MTEVLEQVRERLYTVSETAEILGVTEGRVRQLLLSGQMSGMKFGRAMWTIPESELDKFREPSKVGRPRSRTGQK